MGLRRLRYFLAAADELSFRRASDVVGVSQSVMSRQIAALENEFDVALFERRSTGARLAKVGRVFLTDARRIVTDADRAHRRSWQWRLEPRVDCDWRYAKMQLLQHSQPSYLLIVSDAQLLNWICSKYRALCRQRPFVAERSMQAF